jgi:fibrillarin-like rRNA methylase
MLVTHNLTPDKSVSHERLIPITSGDETVEYREWNLYQSKIGA